MAIKINGKITFLIEVKSAGIALNDSHLRQAINYGANQGIEWVFLTNAVEWRLYRIEFTQPIKSEEVTRFSFVDMNAKKDEDLHKMFLMAREGLAGNAIHEFHQTSQILNKFTIAQILLSEPMLSGLKREMKKFFPDIKVDETKLAEILLNDVLKREVIEGDKVKEAQVRIRKTSNKIEKEKSKKSPVEIVVSEPKSNVA